MITESLTFLFAPIDAVGHVHACIGLGQQLIQRGHKVAFVTKNAWRGKLKALGFVEKHLQDPDEQESTDKWAEETLTALSPLLPLSPMLKLESITMAIYIELIKRVKETFPQMKEIMAEVKPDCVIVDDVIHNPALVDAGVPWILASSINPIGISAKNVPPCFMGEPILNGDKDIWIQQSERAKEVFENVFEGYRNWVLENGGPDLSDCSNLPYWHKHSPYANIYMYPEELDYTQFRPVPFTWHRFDAFARTESGSFEIPLKLKSLPGKLIYFSMGTIGCCEVELMRRLISILSNSPHRFIVSKGPLADKLELAENMWGEGNVPQTLVLPLVDLVITHGGNNTVTESFFFGKRVLVLPLFSDQLDNAQRIEETGLGLQFNPYQVTEKQLLTSIEKLLGDELLERRMISISQRIQSSESQAGAAALIEKVAKNNRNV